MVLAARKAGHLAPGLILLLGAALRLFRLGADSLWYDETVSTFLAGSPLSELLRHTAGDIHPPGYYLLLRAWLLLTGYGTGRADPHGNGLEFVSGFFSLFFGVLLIALVYALARRLTGRRVALVAAALVALSPFNVWYSQEVRMYTLGAVLGVAALWAVMRVCGAMEARAGQDRPELGRAEQDGPAGQDRPELGRAEQNGPAGQDRPEINLRATQQRPIHGAYRGLLLVYMLAAAAGMYTLYYFAFLLIPLNFWALIVLRRRKRSVGPLLLANVGAAVLYAPWIGIAYRQATQPPVPPWRTPPNVAQALLESWTALSFGQSAPTWLWPALVLTLALFVLGMIALVRRGRVAPPSISFAHATAHTTRLGGETPPLQGPNAREINQRMDAVALAVATFGPLLLILVISLVVPLYHVRYLFTYSPAFYIVLAAGLVALWRRARWAGILAGLILLAGAGISLRAFWFDPAFRRDDHRAAVHELQARWRPGDVVLVNAGWPYTALMTYWDGEIAGRYRITGALPEPRADTALVIVTTGHADGAPDLGWGDPRADFFAMPAQVARSQVADLFDRFPRVWHYRIYDTVNDPGGLIRSLLTRHGQLLDERTYPGEAFMRVEEYAQRDGVTWDEAGPGVRFGDLALRFTPSAGQVEAGQTLYPTITWLPGSPVTTHIGTSLRLVGTDGEPWAQPPDEQPLGPLFMSTSWPTGIPQRQPLALPAPLGTPPGQYRAVLVVYDATNGQPLAGQAVNGAQLAEPGVVLGSVTVTRPAQTPAHRATLAEFGPLALVEATTPVTSVPPGSAVPVSLLWQARAAPGQPLVVVIQALDQNGALVANLEEQPLGGRYPTQGWQAGELVADRHTLTLPANAPPGRYRLIVGVYQAADGQRLTTRTGLLTNDVSWIIKEIHVR